MAIKLQIRRGTASNWSGSNPTLESGEIGFETDTGNVKIGDGTNGWNDLAYQFPYLTGNRNHNPEDTTTLVIDQTNDRVGIGTSSPLSKVHVEGTDPVIRFRDTAAAASTHSLISADNADGTLTISADPGNNTGTSNVSKIQFVVDGTTTATVIPNAVGIGTAAPLAELHVESSAPSIIVRDTDGGSTTYGEISAGSAGQLVIAADPNNATASSSVALSVDGTTRVEATTTGATVTGTCTATTFSGSGASLSANTVPIASLANAATATILGRTAAGAGVRSDLSVADVQTLLGLGALAYLASIISFNDTATDISASSTNYDIDLTSLTIGRLSYFEGTVVTNATNSFVRIVSESSERYVVLACNRTTGSGTITPLVTIPSVIIGAATTQIYSVNTTGTTASAGLLVLRIT
jgi:hypothetical protein